jgi:hypothetical protein
MSDQERQPCLQGVPSERERFGALAGARSVRVPRWTGAQHPFDPSYSGSGRCVVCLLEEGPPIHKEAS